MLEKETLLKEIWAKSEILFRIFLLWKFDGTCKIFLRIKLLS